MTAITSRIDSPSRKKAWYRQRWIHVFIAMVIGIVVGWSNPDLGTAMQPLGDGFIKLIRMLIAPIIFCTVVHGITQMSNMARVGRVAIKALIYFEVLTTVALVIGLVAVNVLRPGVGMNVDLSTVNSSIIDPYVKQTGAVGFVPFAMNIIPSTFIGAFSEGNILQVLFISIMCGFALTWMGEIGKPLVNMIDIAAKMIFRIVDFIMWVAPLGAFGSIAFAVGKFGPGSLASLGKMLFTFYLSCVIFIFCVLWPLAHWVGFSLLKLIRYLWEELLICWATTSSETVLPRVLSKMTNAGCDETVVGLVVPTGYSFNLDGTCLYLATATVFLAQATNTALDIEHQITLLFVLLLTSKGAAGINGAAFVILAATLAAHGTIPVTSVALLLGIHRLMSTGLTPTNIIGNAVATIVVAKWENAVDEPRLKRVLDGQS